MNPPEVSLLIPAYNEATNIKVLVESLNRFKEEAHFSFEAIIVDDGSSDGTGEKIRMAAEKYSFVIYAEHKINLGMTHALMTAYSKASGRYVAVFPADLQYRPDCLPDLILPLKKGYDLVAGRKEGVYDKKIISNVYNRLSRAAFKKVRIHDLNSVKAMKREVFESLPLRKDWHRYIAVLAAEYGYRLTEVSVKLYPRFSGESKFAQKSRILIGLFDLLSVKFLLSFSSKPLLLFGTTGIVLVFSGTLTGLGALIARVFFQAGFRPLLSLVLLLVMLGVNLFALGFLAELIVMQKERLDQVEFRLRNIHKDD